MANDSGFEIERKYLLSELPPRVQDCSDKDILFIRQGYVPGTKIHERVRAVFTEHNLHASTVFYRTIKMGSGIKKIEVEEETTHAIFMAMWHLTEGRRITKFRFCVDGWEIDKFEDRQLVLAEIELPSVDTEVTIPDWLAPYVVREVTDESEFANINLAR
jgi:adenylate cyclase